MTRPPDPRRLRARFCSSADLIHRLFVCICGVADQLQTNYPTDLRRVLKMICSQTMLCQFLKFIIFVFIRI